MPVLQWDREDEGGRQSRTVTVDADGSLTIDGYDIGPAVEAFFGHDDYEFHRTVPAEGVARLRAALGVAADGDLLAALQERFTWTTQIEALLGELGVESEFWSWP
jgi:hypothetical protein